MYFLHALKDADFLNDELKTTVERLKKEGKIHHFGFSCHDGNVVELLQPAAETPWVESVMFRYNFRQYGDKKLNQAIDACAKANVGLIAMKTQGSEASFQDAWKKFEQTGKWTKHQAVLKAVWADDRITAAVSHMDTFEKLKQNIAAAVDKTDLGAVELRGAATLRRGHAGACLRRLRSPLRRRGRRRRSRSGPPCATSCTTTSTASRRRRASCSAALPAAGTAIWPRVDFRAGQRRLPARRRRGHAHEAGGGGADGVARRRGVRRSTCHCASGGAGGNRVSQAPSTGRRPTRHLDDRP